MATLTLAIPTYNANAEHLREALESIEGQLSATGDRVRVLVADNSSDAPTAAEISAMVARFPLFHFVRHEENLGFDRNVLRLLDDVHTDYVWFFGDDDLLLPRGLEFMLGALDGHPAPIAVLSPPVFFFETSELGAPVAPADLGAIVMDSSEFMETTAFMAAAMSVTCMSTEAVRNVRIDYALGTNWVHFAALAQACSDHSSEPSALLCNNLVAVRRSNSARWFSNFGNQYRSGLSLISMLREGTAYGLPLQVYNFYVGRRFATNAMDILTLAWPLTWRARRELVAQTRTYFDSYARFRLLDVPLLLAPNWMKATGSAAIRAAGRVRRRLSRRST